MQKCLSFFGELTEAQQVAAARIFRKRLNSSIRNPTAIMTCIAADVQSHYMKQVRLCGCIKYMLKLSVCSVATEWTSQDSTVYADRSLI